MDKLIIVRHGDYDSGAHLSNLGCEQMKALAEKLKTVVNGSSVCILTSPIGRALESAEILNSVFNVGCEQHKVLWSESRHPEDFPVALDLVRSHKDRAEVLILVTHYEYAEGFPRYFAKEELDVQLRSESIQKGEALVIDCQQKTWSHIS
ncbi:MAG: histidine phosphatase family protein [Patescibacteria group bacterium]|nr:histidine phosphatase family protein [Patescibacteria group bacterium]MDD5490953.1 histidine phosphatase family protein [Patescibacteria group bacterium]